MKQRTSYRVDQALALQRIERRRSALGITHVELAAVAGLSRDIYFNMRRDGRAFGRHIIALRFALRTIEQRRRASAQMFEMVDGGEDQAERAAVVALRGVRAVLAAAGVAEDERRAVEVYLLVTACGVNQVTAGKACSCTKQNISKLVKAVENRRDDGAFDQVLSRLETTIAGQP